MKITCFSLLFSACKRYSSSSFTEINAWMNRRLACTTNLPSKSKEMHLNSDLKAVSLWCSFPSFGTCFSRLIPVVLGTDGPFLWDRDGQKAGGLLWQPFFLDGKFWSLRGCQRKWTSVAETQILLVLGWVKGWFHIHKNALFGSNLCLCYHCTLWKKRALASHTTIPLWVRLVGNLCLPQCSISALLIVVICGTWVTAAKGGIRHRTSVGGCGLMLNQTT